MRPSGRILIVDDDPLFLDTYRDLLSSEGYAVETATSRDQALTRLDESDWDVVLLDQKLLGGDGPDEGIELIEGVGNRAPGAKAIIVTAYASEQSIQRAFDAGVYDFLEKSGAFAPLLRAKVRNATEAVRERNLGYLHEDAAEQRIAAMWQSLAGEQDANRKGLLLEELLILLFRSIPGLRHVSNRRKSEDEEIDLVIRNESPDPFWSGKSRYILVECKNWSRPVDARELDLFQAKLERRYGRASLGFFVAMAGFTRGFQSRLHAERRGDALVVCVDPQGLQQLVTSADRNETLKDLHDRAVVEANGDSH